MALGMTKLQAVNLMLLAVGQMRVSALDTGGTSDAGEAEYWLDHIIEQKVAEGHPSCSKVIHQAADGSGEIDLSSVAANAIRVIGLGKFRHRPLSIRNVKVYDEDRGTTACFTAAEVVTLEVYEYPDSNATNKFEYLAPDFKHYIADEAAKYYRQMKKPDQLADAFNAQKAQRSELNKDMKVPPIRHGNGYTGVNYNQIGGAPPVAPRGN